jgi:hypothetical protein
MSFLTIEYEKKLFEERIKKTPSCWIWIGLLSPQGYGRIKIRQKQKVASRLSWEIHYGEIPKGMIICHKCDNPACVNPEHLFIGRHKDNTHDMIRKKRKHSNIGENNPMVILNEEKVKEIRKLHQSGKKIKEIAEGYNLKYFTCLDVVNRRNWRHI